MKLINLLFLGVITFSIHAQNAFDKYENNKDVNSVIVNEKAFSLLASLGLDLDKAEDRQFLETAEKIKGLKVYSTDKKTLGAQMINEANSYINSNALEELMRFNEKGATGKFYVKQGSDENHVKEFVMILNGLEKKSESKEAKHLKVNSVVLFISGDIDMRKLSAIADKMDIPGAEELKKANKNN